MLSTPFSNSPPESLVLEAGAAAFVSSAAFVGLLGVDSLNVITSNVDVATLKSGVSLDGYTFNLDSEADYILLVAQTNPAENGFYAVVAEEDDALTGPNLPTAYFLSVGQCIQATRGAEAGRNWLLVSSNTYRRFGEVSNIPPEINPNP